MGATLRAGLPNIWVTWAAKIIAGEEQCLFAPWFKARYKYDKLPEAGDMTKWRVEHTALLESIRSDMKADGWGVRAEHWIQLRGRTAILSGKIDLLGQRDGAVCVRDAKGGDEKASHAVQVAIYILLLPIIWKRLDLQVTGQVVYKDHHVVPVSWDLAQTFKQPLFELLRRLGTESPQPLEASPSPFGCAYCNIGPLNCPQRWTEDDASDHVAVLTSEF